MPEIAASSDECRLESWRLGEERYGRRGKLWEEREEQKERDKKEADSKTQRNRLSP